MNHHNDLPLISMTCFNSLITNLSVQIEMKHGDWRSFKGLSTRHESFLRRLESVIGGTKERVNLLSELRNATKNWSLGYKYTKTFLDHYYFEKKVTDHLSIGILIDRIHHGGFGKAFTLRLLIVDTINKEHTFCWSDENFEIFRLSSSETPCFTYATKEELKNAIEDMKNLCEIIMPLIEEKASVYFTPDLDNRIAHIESRSNLTAKSGLQEATAEALRLDNSCVLSSLYISSYSYLYPSTRLDKLYGPPFTQDGHLNRHAYISYNFLSSQNNNKTVSVIVPAMGDVAGRRYESKLSSLEHVRKERHPIKIDNSIVDSVQAYEFAEKYRDKSDPENTTITNILMELKLCDGLPCWVFNYVITKSEKREDYHAVIDAATGMYLADVPWRIGK